jgi:hypothetical protein
MLFWLIFQLKDDILTMVNTDYRVSHTVSILSEHVARTPLKNPGKNIKKHKIP